jgi:ribosomal protein S18 acetylase RimI-like enzyme
MYDWPPSMMLRSFLHSMQKYKRPMPRLSRTSLSPSRLRRSPHRSCANCSLIRTRVSSLGPYMVKPVGYIYAQIIKRPATALRHAWERLHIHHIFVHRTQQRRGCGHALIQAVVQFAKAHGITTMTLDVWSFNTQARSFFATQGFTVYNENMWLAVSGQE